MRWLRTLRQLFSKILGAGDTPHRIALGVFLGSVIGWTPTLGFQIAIYIAVATLLRANKLSGVPVLFVSNVFTAVPLYYFCWRTGHFLLHGSASAQQPLVPAEQDTSAEQNGWDELERFGDMDYWTALLDKLAAFGVELWVGSLVLGLAMGLVGYAVTYRAVIAYRQRKTKKAIISSTRESV